LNILELESKYNPKGIEDRIYKKWEEKEYFKPSNDKSKGTYCIVIPPPNITGQLHMGHALDNTIQDVFIRYNRMKGKSTLWLPGTDHASIATEMKVVEKLKDEGKTKESLGREEFLKEAWAWKEKYGTTIVNQLKKLGSSCDWSRERFTMDEGLSNAVKHVFVKLYNKGLIYQGEKIVNWCPCCKTSISDTEVEYKEVPSSLWYINYKVKGSENEFVTIATTRPETMLGDTAVAVNPTDERYKDIIGKKVILPIINKEIPVIADEYVEKDFGTGALKITPAHDPNDFEIGLKHNLEIIKVINESGNIVEGYGKYSGMDRDAARKEIVKELDIKGNLVKIEPYTHNVGKCYRCNTSIEPFVSKQWYVKMKPLAEPAIKAVKDGETKFVPERFEKTYFNWLENIRDWCVSRQLWWGHRIPAYYCDTCSEMIVTEDEPTVCKCGGKLLQDPDVLDTWFSSALWPFSTLGWPDDTEDMKDFYPTNTLVTGYDIITFWVTKMIFSGIEYTGQVPFKHVYIHGLVRDEKGRKMSKSLGNGIDPLEVMETYGTDALRFSLIQNISPGNDIRYIKEKIEAGRNFANKLWNAARFSLKYIQVQKEKQGFDIEDINEERLNPEDKWILGKLGQVVEGVTANVDNFEIGIALNSIYDFAWSDFCDSYIEMVKPRLYNLEKEDIKKNDDKNNEEAVKVLNYVLTNLLKLLHSYMPFITEEIYGHLNNEGKDIIVASWPGKEYTFDFEEKMVEQVLDIVRQIRNVKATSNIAPSKKIDCIMKSEMYSKELTIMEELVKKIAGLGKLEIQDKPNTENMTVIHTENIDAYIDLSMAVNKEEEMQKLLDEKFKAETELARAKGMLENETFVSKAPEALIQKEKEKITKYETLIAKIEESLKKKI